MLYVFMLLCFVGWKMEDGGWMMNLIEVYCTVLSCAMHFETEREDYKIGLEVRKEEKVILGDIFLVLPCPSFHSKGLGSG